MARETVKNAANGSREPRQENDDERTPLIAHREYAHVSDDDRPLPRFQLFLLCLAKLTEPVAFFSIFPFVNQMVYETGIPREHCGFYTGLIESLFSLIQFLIMPVWGRYSDRRGRKPILVASLLGLSITSILFGLSRNVWQMMAFRCLSGLCGGSAVTIRTMISEISTPKTQARAFSLLGFAGNMAIFLAPLMGGALARPGDSFPIFQRTKLFLDFPYLLPCLVTGSLSLVSGLSCLFFLKETLVIRKNGKGATEAAPTTKEILQHEGVKPVLAIYFYTFLLAFMYTALTPVFQFTPIELGGYSFSPKQISYLLAIGGAGQAFWILVVFPPLHKRIGSKSIIRICSGAWTVSFLLYPTMNAALRNNIDRKVFWGIAISFAAIFSGVSMSFTTVQLCLNDISPSPMALGTLNGIGLSGMAGIRAIAPAIITSIFALGVEHQILWGQLAWLVLLIISFGNILAVRYLPRKAYGIVSESTVRIDEESS